jgi:hypothetical protein
LFQHLHRTADDGWHRPHCRTRNAPPAKHASQNRHTADEVREDAAQSSAIRRRNDRHHRCPHHSFGFAFVLFVRRRLRHHLGQCFMVRHFVMHDFMGNLLRRFVSLELVLFEFVLLEFVLFEFVLFEFVRQFMVLEFVGKLVLFQLPLAQHGAGGLSEKASNRSPNCRANDWGGNAGNTSKKRSGSSNEPANASRNTPEELLTAFELVLFEFVRQLVVCEFVRQLVVSEFVRKLVVFEFVGKLVLKLVGVLVVLVRPQFVRKLVLLFLTEKAA